MISGPTSLPTPRGVRRVDIVSTEDLFNAVKNEFGRTECLIMAAAPADFRPKEVSKGKLKKSTRLSSLDLRPTVDILKEIGKQKRNQLIVGFALETDNAKQNAALKLKEKQLDIIIVNQPGPNTGFASDTNQVLVLTRDKEEIAFPLLKKSELAYKLLEIVSEKL